MLVMIDVGSKDEAQLVAASLPGGAADVSSRGYGMVRLQWREREVSKLLSLVAACVEDHRLRWARVRFGDEERTFRAGAPAPTSGRAPRTGASSQ